MSEKCIWTCDDLNEEIWETGCGNLFQLESETPTENGMKFCCYCGKPLGERKPKPTDD